MAIATERLTNQLRSLGVIASWFLRFGLIGAQKRISAALKLRATFDFEFYHRLYADAASLHPIVHYLDIGRLEGRRIAIDPEAQPMLPYDGCDRIVSSMTRRGPSKLTAVQDRKASGETVDVIIPTRNRIASVIEAIESVLEQKHQAKTIWVCDDGSSDGTVARIQSAFSKPLERGQLKLLLGPFGGASAARNAALAASSADWVAYLDSDNLMLPDHLIGLVAGVRAQGAAWAYSNWREGDRVFGDVPYNRYKLLQSNRIDLNTTIHSRALYSAFGGFDEKLFRLNDYDLFLRYGRHFAPAWVNQTTSIKRANADSITSTVDIREPLRRVRENHLGELVAFGLAPNHFVCSRNVEASTVLELQKVGGSIEVLEIKRFTARANDLSRPPAIFIARGHEWGRVKHWAPERAPFRIFSDAD